MKKELSKAFIQRLIRALPDKYDREHKCDYGCNNIICVYSYEAKAKKEVYDGVMEFLRIEGLVK